MNFLRSIIKAIKAKKKRIEVAKKKRIEAEKKKRIEVEERTKQDQKMFCFYSQFISNNDIVFDVGANIGNRSKIFLKLNANVIAVEPQDECIKTLKLSFNSNKNITIVPKALGQYVGEAELMINNENTLSSLSVDWVNAVKNSGRFADYFWDKKKIVSMTTIDNLMKIYGTPSFIKIDVEGFEYEVISGLSKPVKFISLEFTPECINHIFQCIDHLLSIGDFMFNYSIGESMSFELDDYVPSIQFKDFLNKYRNDFITFGDVYCKYVK